MLYLLIAFCIAPSLLLLTYFYIRDRYEAEPIGKIARLFLYGAVAVLPAMVIENALLKLTDNNFVHGFLISASVEELISFLLIYFGIFHNREFDEEYDGIIYAVSLSLGYATVENVLYVLSNGGFGTAVIRAFLPVPGHALFGAIMGFYMGRAKFQTDRFLRMSLLARALLYAWLLHGTYDVLLLVGGVFSIGSVVVIIVLWGIVLKKVRIAQERSCFRNMEDGNMSNHS